MEQIKNFYGKLNFPGEYSLESLNIHSPISDNKFLKIIQTHVAGSVIDLGCGSGLIANLLSYNMPNSKFIGVDFSDSILYAINFAEKNNIKNITYIKDSILTLKIEEKFDTVICHGVLHHIEDYESAIKKIKSLVKPNGTIILGLYHPTGKILKKYIKLNYNSEMLRADQEDVPYETSYTKKQLIKLFSEFDIVAQYPKFPVANFLIKPLQHSKNGGLTIYILKNSLSEN